MSFILSPYRYAAAAAPHRYWRLYVTANHSGNQTVIVQLEMYESKFGPNVCGGGTPSSSSDEDTFTGADKPFTGTPFDNGSAPASNLWASESIPSIAPPHWLAYDFGSGNAKSIVAIGIHGRYTTNNSTNPVAGAVQYSDDGSSWTTAWSFSGLTWTAREFKVLVNPGYTEPGYSGSPRGVHDYWRVFIKQAPSGAATHALAEIQFRATPSGADQADGGTAISKDFYAGEGGFPASNAFDNNAATRWISALSTTYWSWIGYDFASDVAVAEFVLQAGASNASTQAPIDFCLQYSDTGSAPWTTVINKTAESTWSNGESRTFTDPDYL